MGNVVLLMIYLQFPFLGLDCYCVMVCLAQLAGRRLSFQRRNLSLHCREQGEILLWSSGMTGTVIENPTANSYALIIQLLLLFLLVISLLGISVSRWVISLLSTWSCRGVTSQRKIDDAREDLSSELWNLVLFIVSIHHFMSDSSWYQKSMSDYLCLGDTTATVKY